MYPTPCATDYMGAKKNGIEMRGGRFVRTSLTTGTEFGAKLTDAVALLEKENPGQLNPEFSEYLMGWPIGWTDLKPLAMDKFQSWLQLHGKSCQEGNK